MVRLREIETPVGHMIATFYDWESYWSFYTGQLTPEERAIQTELARRKKIFEHGLARRYGLTRAQTRHVTFIFGTIQEARRQMAHGSVRDLVCSRDYELTSRVVRLPGTVVTTTTIKRPTGDAIIQNTVAFTRREPEASLLESKTEW